MGVLRSIITKFGIQLEEGKLKRGETRVAGMKRTLNLAAREARKFKRELMDIPTLLRYAAAAFLANRFVRWLTVDYAQSADAAAKMSRAMGISVERYQEFAHGAQLSGTAIEEVQNGTMQLGKRARDASVGQKKQAQAFKDLGIEIKDANGELRNQDELLLDLADRFAEMPNGTKKTALAMEVMGRSGAKLIPFLNEGRKGILAMGQEARQLGLVLSKEAAKSAEQFNDEMLRAKSAVIGVRNQLAAQLLPSITDLARRFQTWYREGDNAKRLLEGIKTAAKAAAAALATMVAIKVGGQMAKLVTAVGAGIRALRLLGASALFAKLKVALLNAAILLIPLIIEDLYTFAMGGDSLIGEAFGDPKEAEGFRKILLDVGAALKEAWATLAPLLLQLWKALKPLFIMLWKDVIKPLLPYLMKLIAWLIPKLTWVVKWLIKIIRWVIQGVTWLVRTIAAGLEVLWDGIKAAWKGLKAAWNAVVSAMAWVVDKIRAAWDAVVAAVKWIWEGLKSAWNAVVSAMSWVVDRIRAAWDAVVEAVKVLWEAMKKAWENMMEGIKDTLRAIRDFAAKIWNAIVGAVKAAMKKVGDFFTGAADRAKKAWTNVYEAIRKAWEYVKSKVTGAVRHIAAAVTGEELVKIKIPEIPGLGGELTHQVMPPPGTRGPVTQNNLATVQKIEVNVAGTANMTPAEFERTTREAAQAALNEALKAAYQDVKP